MIQNNCIQKSIALNKGYSEFIKAKAEETGYSFSMILNSIIHAGISDYVQFSDDHIKDYMITKKIQELEV